MVQKNRNIKKTQKPLIEFANKKKKITQTDTWGKKTSIKERLKTYLLLENNQPIMHAKPKEKTLTEFLKLNLRVLNTLSRMKYECLRNQKKIYQVSSNWIIRMILTKEPFFGQNCPYDPVRWNLGRFFLTL